MACSHGNYCRSFGLHGVKDTYHVQNGLCSIDVCIETLHTVGDEKSLKLPDPEFDFIELVMKHLVNVSIQIQKLIIVVSEMDNRRFITWLTSHEPRTS